MVSEESKEKKKKKKSRTRMAENSWAKKIWEFQDFHL